MDRFSNRFEKLGLTSCWVASVTHAEEGRVKVLGTFKTKREAEAAIAEMMDILENSDWPGEWTAGRVREVKG